MARKWDIEADIDDGSMEEMLIEVFGCVALDKTVVKSDAVGDARMKTDFYLAGNAMEAMLIEVFGCTPLYEGAIRLDAERDGKRRGRDPYLDADTAGLEAVQLSASA